MKIIDINNPVNWSSPLNQSLVGWWKVLPYANNFTMKDLLRKNNSSSNNNTTLSRITHKGGFGSINFNGVDSQISVPTFKNIENLTRMTLCAWARCTGNASSYREVVRKGNWFLLLSNNDHWCFSAANSPSEYGDSSTPTLLGEWAFLVGTFDGTITRLYKNGILYEVVNPGGGISNTLSPLNIGTNGGQSFPGQIDDVRVYRDKALSQAEVYTLYQESSNNYPNLLNYRNTIKYFLPQIITPFGTGFFSFKGSNNKFLVVKT